MSEFDVERGFISCLLGGKDIATVRDNRITPRFFTGDNRPAYKYILDMSIKTGDIPTVRAFRREFPKYSLEEFEGKVGTEENIKYWIAELRRKVKQNSLADSVEDAANFLNEEKAEEALTALKKEIMYIESEVEETSDVLLNENLDLRKKEYEQKQKTEGMMGIPTGLPFIDFMLKGLAPETLTTVIANTGVGKTYFEILVGAYASLNGYCVLQCMTEMSERQMRDRYEMILFGMTVGAINNNDFRSGKLSPDMKKKYFNFLDEIMPDIDIPMITAISPMQIEANIDKYNPDLVLIDGVYLMQDDEKAESDWLRIAHITRALKLIAKRKKVALMINSQADKNTSKKTGPELGDISFSQAIGQDSDNVLTAYRTPIMYTDKEMCVKILKGREGGTGKAMLSWDFSNMQFKEIYNEKDSGGSEVVESESNEESSNPYIEIE